MIACENVAAIVNTHQMGLTVLNELKLLNTHINYERKLQGLEVDEEDEEEKEEVTKGGNVATSRFRDVNLFI